MIYLFRLIWKPSRSLKKCMFRIMNMSLNLILHWKHCYSGLASISTMRCGIYEDAMKEYGLGLNYEIHTFWASWEWNYPDQSRTPSSGPIVPHCVVDVNTSPECQCHHHRDKINDIDMFRNKHFFFSMVLEKVSMKQSREHWLRIPYGVERRVRIELKSVKIIMVYNLCFHFNSNNLLSFLYLFD